MFALCYLLFRPGYPHVCRDIPIFCIFPPWQMYFAPAEVVLCCVGGDPVKPCIETRLVTPAPHRLPGLKEGFLSKISSLLFVSYHMCKICAYAGRVVFEQSFKSLYITRLCLFHHT